MEYTRETTKKIGYWRYSETTWLPGRGYSSADERPTLQQYDPTPLSSVSKAYAKIIELIPNRYENVSRKDRREFYKSHTGGVLLHNPVNPFFQRYTCWRAPKTDMARRPEAHVDRNKDMARHAQADMEAWEQHFKHNEFWRQLISWCASIRGFMGTEQSGLELCNILVRGTGIPWYLGSAGSEMYRTGRDWYRKIDQPETCCNMVQDDYSVRRVAYNGPPLGIKVHPFIPWAVWNGKISSQVLELTEVDRWRIKMWEWVQGKGRMKDYGMSLVISFVRKLKGDKRIGWDCL